MGLEPFEVSFFVRVKFTKVDLALKGVIRNRLKLWAANSLWYEYKGIQLHFSRVKTHMGLERFENVP